MDRSPLDAELSRRNFLKVLGPAALGGSALLGYGAWRQSRDQPGRLPGSGNSTGTGSDPANRTDSDVTDMVHRHGIPFDREVGIVDDYGADPNGETPITTALSRAMEPGTLITFPEGTYQLPPQPIEIPADNVGVRGRGNVVWKFADGYHGPFVRCVHDNFLFEGIDVDMSGRPWESGYMLVMAPSRFHIEDVEYIGRGQGPGHAFKLGIDDDSAGLGILRNVRVPHGSRPDVYASSTTGKRGDGRIGVFAYLNHVGTLRIENCEFSEFGNNGIYASRVRGNVRVKDSYFLNNAPNSIRLSGKGSWAKRCTVEIDTSKYDGPPMETEWGAWGITCENAVDRTTAEYSPREPGVLVEDCEVRLTETNELGKVGAGIRLASKARTMTVRDTTVQVDIDSGFSRSTHGILRVNPFLDHRRYRKDMPDPPKPHSLTLENVRVTGSAAGSSAVRITKAAESELRRCRIIQTGNERNGVFLYDPQDVVIDGGTISTTEWPIVINAARANRCLLSYVGDPELESSGQSSTEQIQEGDVLQNGIQVTNGSAESGNCISFDSSDPDTVVQFHLVGLDTEGFLGSIAVPG
jgi:hypothetical protein